MRERIRGKIRADREEAGPRIFECIGFFHNANHRRDGAGPVRPSPPTCSISTGSKVLVIAGVDSERYRERVLLQLALGDKNNMKLVAHERYAWLRHFKSNTWEVYLGGNRSLLIIFGYSV